MIFPYNLEELQHCSVNLSGIFFYSSNISPENISELDNARKIFQLCGRILYREGKTA